MPEKSPIGIVSDTGRIGMGIGVDITVAEEEGVHLVSIDGRVDASTTPVIEKRLAGVLEASNKVLIDFAKVDYLSSAGLRLLLSSTKKMRAKNGVIGFFGMDDEVMEIIHMAGFERVLSIFKTKKEALEAL